VAGSVEIYVNYPGPAQSLAREVCEELDLMRYFRSGTGYVLPIEARSWTGEEGWGHLLLEATDPEIVEGTAFAPYGYELSLDYRGARERFGWAVFRRLTRLDLPLAYGNEMFILADFLPGRGNRDFSPGTDAEDLGSPAMLPPPSPAGPPPLWFEPRLHGDRTARWPRRAPSAPAAGAATVFETGGLLQAVPVAGGRWVRPVAAMRAEAGARSVGEVLEAALLTTVRYARDDRAEIGPSLAGAAQLSTEDFAATSVRVDLSFEGDEVAALPRAPQVGSRPTDPPGPVVAELVHRVPAATGPQALGELVLDLLAALRSQVPT
jgi:hypothetical protein